MPQIISCPFCQQQFTVAEDQVAGYINSQVTCSACHKTFSIVQNGTELRAVDPAGMPPINAPNAGAKQGKLKNRLAIGGIVVAVATLVLATVALYARNTLSSSSSLVRAREKANQIKCASNLRQIGMAAQLYAQDNLRLGRPYGPGFAKLLQTQQISPQEFHCPSDSSTGTGQVAGSPCSYIWLGQNLGVSSDPACVLAYEPLTNHGKEGSNFLFADGHVDFVVAKDASGMVQQLEQGKNPPKIDRSSQVPQR